MNMERLRVAAYRLESRTIKCDSLYTKLCAVRRKNKYRAGYHLKYLKVLQDVLFKICNSENLKCVGYGTKKVSNKRELINQKYKF